MKKFIVLVLCASLALASFAACGGNKSGVGSASVGESSAAESVESGAAESSLVSDGSSADESSAVSAESSAAESAETSADESGDLSVDDSSAHDLSDVTEYKNDYVSFNYPSFCEVIKTDGAAYFTGGDEFSIDIVDDTESADMYDGLTVEKFTEMVGADISELGFTLSNASVETKKNQNGVEMTVISYRISAMGAIVNIDETVMAIRSGGTVQVITVTENVDCGELVQMVFDSVKVLK